MGGEPGAGASRRGMRSKVLCTIEDRRTKRGTESEKEGGQRGDRERHTEAEQERNEREKHIERQNERGKEIEKERYRVDGAKHKRSEE